MTFRSSERLLGREHIVNAVHFMDSGAGKSLVKAIEIGP